MSKTQTIKTITQKIELTKKDYSLCIIKIFNTLSKLYRQINAVMHSTILIYSRIIYQLEPFTT